MRTAAQEGQHFAGRHLLKEGTAKNKGEEKSWTPLLYGCWSGHRLVVRELVQADVDVKKAANDRFTPLYAACENGHLTVVRELAQAGADVDKAANDEYHPIVRWETTGVVIETCVKYLGGRNRNQIYVTDTAHTYTYTKVWRVTSGRRTPQTGGYPGGRRTGGRYTVLRMGIRAYAMGEKRIPVRREPQRRGREDVVSIGPALWRGGWISTNHSTVYYG